MHETSAGAMVRWKVSVPISSAGSVASSGSLGIAGMQPRSATPSSPKPTTNHARRRFLRSGFRGSFIALPSCRSAGWSRGTPRAAGKTSDVAKIHTFPFRGGDSVVHLMGAFLTRAGIAGPIPGERQVIGTRLHNYEIVSLIGEGGMGSVYLARHRVLGRPAAIKVMRREYAEDEASVARFVNE